MKIMADLHTHTLVSQHAYSTLDELCLAAKEQGMVAIGMTDHGPGMPDGAIAHHFYCLRGLPHTINGLTLYKGAEANIMNYDGELDLPDDLLHSLDFVIASYHVECIDAADCKQHTRGLLKVIANPAVDCIGHCGNPVYQCDYEAIVKACKEYGKLLEINSNSFSVRPGSDKNCKAVAELCMKHRLPVIVSSDAHSKYQVGDHRGAIEMLESIHFPQELILNASESLLKNYFAHK